MQIHVHTKLYSLRDLKHGPKAYLPQRCGYFYTSKIIFELVLERKFFPYVLSNERYCKFDIVYSIVK